MLLEPIVTPLPGLVLLKPVTQFDSRGSFTKVFHASTFAALGLNTGFTESYYSTSSAGVLRGMHLQLPPHDHAKLVYVTAGRVLDVVVDLRAGPTYGQHFSAELSAENRLLLYLPVGFAHGFYVTEGPATMVYLVTKEYAAASDTGIRWDSFGFVWPDASPIISARDAGLSMLENFSSPFTL